MDFHLKRKLLFALIMALFTTGIISFTVISVNLGFIEMFIKIWLKSWGIAYLIAVPCILIIGPPIEKLVHSLFREDFTKN